MTLNQRMTIDVLKNHLETSLLNRHPYRSDNDLLNIFERIERFTRNSVVIKEEDVLPENADGANYLYVRGMVPPFQRNNDKWSVHMQSAYIESVLRGHKADIMLYTTKARFEKDHYQSVQILDGLQRLSAMCNFVAGKVNAFGYSFDELRKNNVVHIGTTFGLTIYNFNTESDAAIYYIQMNRNVTHSAQDIDRAVNYFEASVAFDCLGAGPVRLAEVGDFEHYVMSVHGGDVEKQELPNGQIIFKKPLQLGDTLFHVHVAGQGKGDCHPWVAKLPVSMYSMK